VLADAVSFLASAGCLLSIRAAEPRPAPSARRRLRRELAEGLGFVLGQPALRAITACTALTNLLWAAAGTVQLLFLVHQVGLDPAAIGLLVSAGAAGGLLAALAATRVGRGADTARLIWLPVTVTAPFALCTPLTAPGWRVALLPWGWPSPPSARSSTTSPRTPAGYARRACGGPAKAAVQVHATSIPGRRSG
jgi:hypothetical protein